MTHDLQSALPEGLTLLQQITLRNTQPKTARTLLRPLQDRFPNIQFDLVWETMGAVPGDQHTHYDLLLQQPGHATATLSYCPSREIPWALQGASRWADKDLVRVNTTTLGVDRALAALDFIWDDRQLMTHLVNHCIVTDQLKKSSIVVSDDELAEAEADYRQRKGLRDKTSWDRWLDENGMNAADWSNVTADRLRIAKLRKQVVSADKVASYFVQHRQDWQPLTLLIVPFSDRAQAERARDLVLSQRASLAELAERQLAANSEADSGGQPSFVTCRRGELPSILLEALDNSRCDQVVGPLAEADQWLLVRQLSERPAELDDVLREQIEGLLFAEWLEEQRQAAQIEWFWGPSE